MFCLLLLGAGEKLIPIQNLPIELLLPKFEHPDYQCCFVLLVLGDFSEAKQFSFALFLCAFAKAFSYSSLRSKNDS